MAVKKVSGNKKKDVIDELLTGKKSGSQTVQKSSGSSQGGGGNRPTAKGSAILNAQKEIKTTQSSSTPKTTGSKTSSGTTTGSRAKLGTDKGAAIRNAYVNLVNKKENDRTNAAILRGIYRTEKNEPGYVGKILNSAKTAAQTNANKRNERVDSLLKIGQMNPLGKAAGSNAKRSNLLSNANKVASAQNSATRGEADRLIWQSGERNGTKRGQPIQANNLLGTGKGNVTNAVYTAEDYAKEEAKRRAAYDKVHGDGAYDAAIKAEEDARKGKNNAARPAGSTAGMDAAGSLLNRNVNKEEADRANRIYANYVMNKFNPASWQNGNILKQDADTLKEWKQNAATDENARKNLQNFRIMTAGPNDPRYNVDNFISDTNAIRDNGWYTGNDVRMMNDQQLQDERILTDVKYKTALKQEQDYKNRTAEDIAAKEQAKRDAKDLQGRYQHLAVEGVPYYERGGEYYSVHDDSDQLAANGYLKKRPEDYEDYREDYDRLLYEYLHGKGTYAERIDAIQSDDDVDELENEMDRMWDAIENGSIDKMYSQAQADYMTVSNEATGNYGTAGFKDRLDEIDSENERRKKIRELEANAPKAENGVWEYDPSLVKTYKEDGTNIWDGFHAPGEITLKLKNEWQIGDEVDKIYQAVGDPFNPVGADYEYGNLEDLKTLRSIQPAYYMTPEQKQTFLGYYLSGDKESAKAFYDALVPSLNMMADAHYNSMVDKMSRNEYAPLMIGARVLLPEIAGAVSTVGSIKALFGDKDAQKADSEYYRMTNALNTIQAARSDVWGDWAAEHFGEEFREIGEKSNGLAYSIIDNARRQLITKGATAPLGIAMDSAAAKTIDFMLLGSDVMGNTMAQEIKNGRKPDEAFVRACGSAIIEVVTENMWWDKLFSADVKDMLGTPGQFAKYMKNIFQSEGWEEVSGNVMDAIFDDCVSVLYGHRSELNEKYHQLIDQGKTPEEAGWEVGTDFMKEAGWAYLSGGLSALISGGARGIAARTENRIAETSLGKTAIKHGTQNIGNKADRMTQELQNEMQIISAAEGMDPGTESRKLAKELREGFKNGSGVDYRKFGQLIRAVVNESNEQIGDIVQNALGDTLKEQLLSAGEKEADAIELSQILMTGIVNQSLTPEMLLAIHDNENAMKLWREYRISDEAQQAQEQIKPLQIAQKSVMDLITEPRESGITAENVSGMMAGAQAATAEDIAEADAQGKRSGSALEVIADGLYGEITGFTTKNVKDADGKNQTVVQVQIGEGPAAKTVDISQVKGLTDGAAQVLQVIAKDRGQVIGNETAKALLEVAGKTKDLAGTIADSMKIMWSAAMEQKAPKTNLDTKTQKTITSAVQADMDAAEERRVANWRQIKPGQGTTTFNGHAYGTKGFNDALAELGETERKEANVIGNYAKMLGVDVVLYNDANESAKQGAFYGGQDGAGIRINLAGTINKQGAHRSAVATFAHEVTHNIEANSPTQYKALRSFVLQNMQRNGMNLQNELQHIMDNYEAHGESIDMAGAIAELVAMGSEQVLTNEQLAAELKQQDGTLYGKVQRAVNRLISQIRGIKGDVWTSSSRYARALWNVSDQMAKVWKAAYQEAQGTTAPAEIGAEKAQAAVSDEDYVAAVNSGDMEAAQRMVDEAAKEAGYSIKAYHGSNAAFTQFKGGVRDEMWFGDRPETSYDRNYTYNTYLKMKNPAEFTYFLGPDSEFNPSIVTEEGRRNGHDGGIVHFKLNPNKVNDTLQILSKFAETLPATDSFGDNIIYMPKGKDRANLAKPGETLIEFMKRGAKETLYDWYVVYNSEQIKSADPVTYDDDGNVIPLSERFNTQKKDIRYSFGDENTTSDENTIRDENGQQLAQISESGSVTKYSLRSWNEDNEVTIFKKLVAAGYEPVQVRKWIHDVNSVAAIIAADKDRLDYKPDRSHRFRKPNADVYKYTLDASTLCAKRLLYQGTFNEIQKQLPNTPLKPGDLIELANMMHEMGFQTPCGICYVESRRRHTGNAAQQWLEKYDGEYKPNYADLTTTDGLAKLKEEHPQAYKDFIKAMNKRGSGSVKLVQWRTDYRKDLRRMSQDMVNYLNSVGGIRVQSFSDFETPHLIDMMQAVLDMTMKGLKSQGYTKVPNFAWVFGDTGIKINLSLMGEGTGLDKNGKLIFSNTEGMDFDEAMKLRDRYSKNVGTILVGMNEDHIIAAMGDDRIDFIIPFHKSGWSQEEFEKMTTLKGYDDFEKFQNEKHIVSINADGNYEVVSLDKGENNIMPEEYWDFSKNGQTNAERYLEICKERGLQPKFWNFLTDNGDGSYSLPTGNDQRSRNIREGYWKTLIDFKMYDNDGVGAPQQTVKPNINMVEANRVLREYEGGANTLPKAEPVIDRYVKWYKEQHPGRAVYSMQDDAETAEIDKEYMAAVNLGYFESAEKLVDEAAKKAGYNIKAYHGTPNGKFNVFEKSKVGTSTDFGKLGRGFYFTAKKQVADYYAGYLPNSTVMPVYLKLENPFVLGRNYDNMSVREMYDSILGEGGTVDEKRSEELTQWLTDNGYDGIIADDEYMVLNPENIKSAETVTYDKYGDVIPLSERFNDQKKDIRWSIQDDADYMDAVNSGDTEKERRIIDQAAKRAGYTVKAYHGTDAFGFTEFDMDKSQNAVFVAYTKDVAGTYTNVNEVRGIRGAETKDYESMFSDELAEYAQEIITEDDDGYTLYDITLNAEESDELGEEVFNLFWDNYADEEDEDYDGGPTTYVQKVTRDALIKMIESRRNKEGIYELYTKPGNQLVVNLNKDSWKRIPWTAVVEATNGEAENWTDKLPYQYLRTRQLAAMARKNGYDSVRLNNITDHGGRNFFDLDGVGDIGIFFNPNDVKSADVETYDNDGNIIPPSERFNDQKKDIRWSMQDDTDYDVKAWMETVPEWSLRTEAEKALLRNYGSLRRKNQMDGLRMEKIDNEIKRLEGMLQNQEKAEGTPVRTVTVNEALKKAGVKKYGASLRLKSNGETIGALKLGVLGIYEKYKDILKQLTESGAFEYDEKLGIWTAKEQNIHADEERDIKTQLSALRIKKQNLQGVMDQTNEQLAKITGDEGFGNMMYQQNKVLNSMENIRTQKELTAHVEKLEEAVKVITDRIAANKKAVEKLNQSDSMQTIREILESTTAKQAAADLKKEFHSTWKQNEILPYISEIIAKMTAGEDYMESVEDLAEILMTSDTRNTYEGLSALRGLTITIGKNEQRELKAKDSSLAEIRQKLEGTGIKVKYGDTSTLDTDVADLRAEYPTMPEFGNDLNALDEFIDWVNGMRGRTEDEFYEQHKAEATAKVLQKVAAVMKNGKLYVPSDSKAKQQIMDLVEYMKGLNAETEEAERTLADVAKQLEAMKQESKGASGKAAVLMRDVNVALDYYNRISRIAADEAKQKNTSAVIEQLKSEQAQKILKNNEEWRQLIERDKNARDQLDQNRKTAAQINTSLKRMYNLLKNPKGTKNIPEYMQGLAREVLGIFAANDTAGGRRFLNATQDGLKELNRLLEAWEKQDGPFNPADLSAAEEAVTINLLQDLDIIREGITAINTPVNGKNKLDTLQQRGATLKNIQEAVSEIYSAIRAENEVQIGDRRVKVEDAAYKVAAATQGKNYREWTGKMGGAIRALHKAIISGNMTPEYFFRTVGNEGLNDLWEAYHWAENRNGLELAKAQARLDEIAKQHGYKNWDMGQTIKVPLESGETELTLGQVMSLWATWKREKTLGPQMSEHLTKGGFYAEKDLRDGLLGRTTIERKAHRVTEEDMAKVRDLLTEEQRKFVDDVVLFMSRDMSALGNAASMAAYGIKMYKERYYFPFQMWDGVKSRKSNDAGSAAGANDRAFHPSFSKSRMHGANNALVIGDFMQTAADHIAGMINYATMGLANESMQKVLNQQTAHGPYETKRNTRAILEEAYGREVMQYLAELQNQLNGGAVRTSRSLGDKAISLFRKNAVAGSLSVALQQPLSYIRAAMLINPKYLTKAALSEYWKNSYKERMAYSGVSVIKEMGRFDMALGQSAREYLTPDGKESTGRKIWEGVKEYSTILPELMDRWTWNRMWVAVKSEQAALHPEMDVKSEEFLQMVGERFNELMRRTQVYDSVLVKSANMRSDNYFVKSMTSFMAEPTLTINVLADAVRMAAQKEKGGKMQLAKAGATFILSAVLQAAFKGLMSSGRTPDEKKTWLENFLYRFFGNLLNEADPLQLVPGYSDAVTLLKDGKLQDDAMGAFGKLFTAGQKGVDLLLGNGGKNGVYRDIEDSVGQLVQLFSGLPLKNLMRDARAMWNWAVDQPYAERPTDWNSVKFQTIDTFMNADNLWGVLMDKLGESGYDTSNAGYYQRIYAAKKAGDEQAAQDMIDYLLNGKGVKAETISSKMAALAKADTGATAEETAGFLISEGKDPTDYIKDQLKAGSMSAEDARKMLQEADPQKNPNDVWWAVDRIQYQIDNGLDKTPGGSYYRLWDAMDNNSTDQIREALDTMTDHGIETKNIKTQITKQYKAAYLEADANGKRKIRDAIEKAYKLMGLTAEDADKVINKWK